MSVYLLSHTGGLKDADLEYRLRSLAGRRCTPSSCGVFAQNFATTFMFAEYKSLIAKRIIASFSRQDFTIGSGFIPSLDFTTVPDLPIGLPRTQVAYRKALDPAVIKRIGLSPQKSNSPHTIYTLHSPTIMKFLECKAVGEIIPGFRAPVGFGSLNSVRALVLVRKIISAFVSTRMLSRCYLDQRLKSSRSLLTKYSGCCGSSPRKLPSRQCLHPNRHPDSCRCYS